MAEKKNCVENTPIYVFCILPRECDINTAAPFLRYFQTEKFSLVVSFPWNVDKYIEFSFLKINRRNLEREKCSTLYANNANFHFNSRLSNTQFKFFDALRIRLEGFLPYNFSLYGGIVNAIDTIQMNNKVWTGRLSSQFTRDSLNRINNLFSGTFLSLRRYITVSSPIFIYFYPMGRLLFDVLDTWNIICWYSVCTWCPTEIENERNQYWVSFWIKYSRDFIWRCFEFYRALFFMLLSSSGAQIIHLS